MTATMAVNEAAFVAAIPAPTIPIATCRSEFISRQWDQSNTDCRRHGASHINASPNLGSLKSLPRRRKTSSTKKAPGNPGALS